MTSLMKSSRIYFIALGLLIAPVLEIKHLNAAEMEEVDTNNSIELVEIVIQINEPQIRPEQPEDHLPLENHEAPIAITQNEERAALTPAERNWEITHLAFDIAADFASLTGSSLFLATQSFANPLLFPLSAGVAAGCYTVEFFRGFTPKLAQIKKAPASLTSVCTMIGSVGQTAGIIGLGLLAANVHIESAVWTLIGGAGLRVGALTAQLSAFGLEKTFGNRNTIRNIIFKIGFGAIAGTAGGIVLATGISAESSELVVIGIYTLGTSGLISTTELLISDLQDLQSLRQQGTETTP